MAGRNPRIITYFGSKSCVLDENCACIAYI